MDRLGYPNSLLVSIVRKDFILRRHHRKPDRLHWADRMLMERGAWDCYDDIKR